jgi:hypothetical protein
VALQDTLNAYRASVIEIRSHISLAFQLDAAGEYVLSKPQRDFITDSAFLKVYIAWETFLESAFIKYMTGLPTITGSVVTRHVTPIDTNHANDILIGVQTFVDWSRADVVLKLSSLYFVTGNPFQVYIGTVVSDLQDLKTIRNALAHLSSTTSVKLDALASRLLGRPVTSMGVSDLIFMIDPTSAGVSTIIDSYLNKLDIVAEGIANG